MPYHNVLDGFHYVEVQRGNNRDITITPPNHGTARTFREVDGQGPIQQDQNWYHHNVPAFYDALARAIIDTYNPAADTFAVPVNVRIHRTEYEYTYI